MGILAQSSPTTPPYTPTRCSENRQDQFPPGNLFVAVSEGLWDNGAACGRRYRLRCLSEASKPCKHGTIDVKVVDFYPSLVQRCFRRHFPLSKHENQRGVHTGLNHIASSMTK